MASIAFHSQLALAKVDLPPNVTTKPYGGGGNRAIDTIDYSFSTEKVIPFARVKLCVARNITNNEVQLTDRAGSFVTGGGNYYQGRSNSTIQGGSVFKYIDDATGSLIAQGSISRQGGFAGIIGMSIRFDLEMALSDGRVQMTMRQIESAMKNTGTISNDGFNPIGAWTGSMYKKHILALDNAADQIKACIME